MNFHTALRYLHPSVHPVQALFDPQSRTYERYLQQQEHHIRSWKEPWQTLTASVAAAAARPQKCSTYCYWRCRRFSALLLGSGRAWLTQHTWHTRAGRQDSLVGFETSHLASLWYLFRKSTSAHPLGLLALKIAADHLCWFPVLKREIAFFGIKAGTMFSRYGSDSFSRKGMFAF